MREESNEFLTRRISDMPDEFLIELFTKWTLCDKRITQQHRDMVFAEIDLRSVHPNGDHGSINQDIEAQLLTLN